MIKKALIIVDVQNDFISGSLSVPDGVSVVGPINKLIKMARNNGWLIVASRDWHPVKTSHFKEFGGLWPSHCVKETFGAEFHKDLDISKVTIVSKATAENEDAYSAFDGCTDSNIKLADFFRSHDIKEVYVGGLATDYCVKATALDAVRNGFETIVVLDACRSVNICQGDGDRAIDEMKTAGVTMNLTNAIH